MITAALLATSTICFLAVVANVRLRRAVARARDEADHDPLTGLLRRHVACRHLVQRRMYGQSTTAILFDMDDFKSINDRHGHQAGDQLIAAVGLRLATYARRLGGSAARLGGDEFLLLVPALTPLDHISQTEAILDDLARPITADSHTGSVKLKPSATAGIATGTASDDWACLIRAADIALYRAKQAGTPYCYEGGHNSTATRPTGRGRRERRNSSPSESATRSMSQTSLAAKKNGPGRPKGVPSDRAGTFDDRPHGRRNGYRLGGEAGSGTEVAGFPRRAPCPYQTIGAEPVPPHSDAALGQYPYRTPAQPGTC